MQKSAQIRRLIVTDSLHGNEIRSYSEPLNHILQLLRSIVNTNNKYQLYIDNQNFILADLTYEIEELKKDILFCNSGFEKLNELHIKKHKDFQREIDKTIRFLKSIDAPHFITDRDGTINNYCGRYQSSIQSAYNAIWLTNFAKNKAESTTILTSAPIANPGILDVNVSPLNDFIIAGSKGREFIFNEQKFEKDISKIQKEKLQELSHKIRILTEKAEFKKFTLIGSGLQFKFGQITLARQDITTAIPNEESLFLLETVKNIVKEVDPEQLYLRIEDTGMDIEIMLTIKNNENVKDFDKGDGINFIDQTLKLGFYKGNCLVCGDTHSDIPMVTKLLTRNEKVFSIFVTRNPKLINELNNRFDNNKLLIVSTPDVLITSLGLIASGTKI
jgi:hypothetical protein